MNAVRVEGLHGNLFEGPTPPHHSSRLPFTVIRVGKNEEETKDRCGQGVVLLGFEGEMLIQKFGE